MTGAPLVELRGIVKRFPGLVANDGVDLELQAGEVHALLGENGAGKTTLMNILTGLYRPDEGDILVDGRPVSFRAPRNAIEAGIGMVHQHFRLVESLTVAENVLLGWHTPRLWLGRKAGIRQVAELAERYRMPRRSSRGSTPRAPTSPPSAPARPARCASGRTSRSAHASCRA